MSNVIPIKPFQAAGSGLAGATAFQIELDLAVKWGKEFLLHVVTACNNT
jgi:hypothetical protein